MSEVLDSLEYPSLQIKEFISKGGKSVVFLASKVDDPSFICAVKGFVPENIVPFKNLQEFIKNQKVKCKYVIELFGKSVYEQKPRQIWISMEYVPGYSANDLLVLILTEDQIGSLVLQVLKGLAYLHNLGLSHSDISPANILIDWEGRVKLCDVDEIFVQRKYFQDGDVFSLGNTIIELVEKFPPLMFSQRPFQNEKIYHPNVLSFARDCISHSSERPPVEELLKYPLVSKISDETAALKNFFPEKRPFVPTKLVLNGRKSMGYFEGMAIDVLAIICSFIEIRDLVHLSIASVKFKQTLESDIIWIPRLSFFLHKVGSFILFYVVISETNAKQLFVHEYKMRKLREKVHPRGDQKEFPNRVLEEETKMKKLMKKKLSGTTPQIKVVMVGDGAAGKTCAAIRLMRDEFPNEYIPTLMENFSINYSLYGVNFEITFWDTAGQSDYDRLRPLSYPNTNVFLIVTSLFGDGAQNISRWLDEVRNWDPNANVILVGTKYDLFFDKILDLWNYHTKEPMPYTWGQQIAQRWKFKSYVETSAKVGYGLDVLKYEIVRVYLESRLQKSCSLQ